MTILQGMPSRKMMNINGLQPGNGGGCPWGGSRLAVKRLHTIERFALVSVVLEYLFGEEVLHLGLIVHHLQVGTLQQL